MRTRLLKRFPQLEGLEGVFTESDGIAEWLIPFGDLELGEVSKLLTWLMLMLS